MNFQKLEYKSKLNTKTNINKSIVLTNNNKILTNIITTLEQFKEYIILNSKTSNIEHGIQQVNNIKTINDIIDKDSKLNYYILYKNECDKLVSIINSILHSFDDIQNTGSNLDNVYNNINNLLNYIDVLRTTINNDNKKILYTINELKNNAKLLYSNYKKELQDIEITLHNEDNIKTREQDRILSKQTDYIIYIKCNKDKLEKEYVNISNTLFNKNIELDNINTELNKYIELKRSYRA
jgi:hypothetical protein